MSLIAAGTAYAAIPDANGLIRGCYNVFTGSARIVDANSCNLLERAISWQQTGPQGPAGAQGPVGPQGPSGNNNISVGRGSLSVDSPVAPTRSVQSVIEDQTITAPTDGFCMVTISATQLESTGPMTFRSLTVRDDGQRSIHFQTAIMKIDRVSQTGSEFDSHASATLMDSFDVEAGRSYKLGVILSSQPDEITIARPVGFALGWICQFEE